MSNPIVAADVESKAVDWLWPHPDTGLDGRIPRGMMTVIAGRPDGGKGLTAALIAAEVSKRGGKVLYSAVEDDHGKMTKPRLKAAGANLNNILLWRFMLPLQHHELEEIVMGNNKFGQPIDLIVIDPLASALTGGISRHSDNIRQVTNPLSELIEVTNTAIVIIEHALKRVSKNAHPLTAIGGSGSGLPAACRMGFLAGPDPQDDDRRILACVKCNIAERPQAMAFETDVTEVDDLSMPYLIYEEEVVFDAIRLVTSEPNDAKVGRPSDKRAAAAEWLTNYLWAAQKPVLAGKVFEDAKQANLAEKTLRRAVTDMGVIRNPPGGGRNCTWDLPDDIKDLLKPDDDEQEEPAASPASGTDDGDDDVDALVNKLLGGS